MSHSAIVPLGAVHRINAHLDWALISARLFLIFAILGASALGVSSFIITPRPAPADIPADQFSAARASQDLAVIAAQPHPAGSPANTAVRDYLLAAVARLGLDAEVQRTTISELSPISAIAQVTPVENILVRLPGTNGGRAALLVSGHYDSVPTTPGAGDCGSCAATVLETLRAVAAGPRLQNDVIFLWTDAEELGIAGATAFIQEHPWAQDVRFSLVLEGLGTRGSALLYANGPNQGGVVRDALGAMQYPAAFGYLHDVMWGLSGNSGSDLDAFVADGQPGLAFVHISLDGSQSYHNGADNVAALEPGTLQQHGDQALSLVRRFADADLDELVAVHEPQPVYFSLLPYVIVTYAQDMAQLLALAAGLLALAAVVYGWRRRAFGLLGLLAAIFILPLGMLLATTAGTGAWFLLRNTNSNYHIYSVGGWYGAAWIVGGLTLLALSITAAVQWLWGRRANVNALAAAALLWFAAFAQLTATTLPGFGYLFAWPLLLAAPAAAWCWWKSPARVQPWAAALVLAAPAAAIGMLFSPVVYGLAVFAGRMEAMLAVPLAALPLPLVALAGSLLAPQLEFLTPRRRWQTPALLLAGSLLLVAIGLARSGFDADHPKLNSITYWLDADSGSARWIALNDSRAGRGTRGQLDEWTAQFLGSDPATAAINPWLSGWFEDVYPILQADAPALDLAHSQINVLADHADRGQRRVKLQITPPAGVQDVFMQITGSDAIQATALNEKPLSAQPRSLVQINLVAAPKSPATIDLTVPAGAMLRVATADRRLGLPDTGQKIMPRQPWMAAAPFNDFSDSTVVAHTLAIPTPVAP